MGPGDFRLFRNLPIADAATSNTTSQVGEPSVANNGRWIFMSGNWYASLSLDNGVTWRYVNPYTTFPGANGGFCCDQVVHYDPSRDLLFWLLQYVKDSNRNTLRLAIARGSALVSNSWYWYDFTPNGVNSSWTRQWFDYPDLALSNNYLYISTNVFRTTNDSWTRSVILRIPLDQLASGVRLSYNYYQTTERFALRCTQGAKNVMYLGAHNNLRSIRVYNWPEGSTTISLNDITISPWSDATRRAPGPDGRDWCGRADGRITGGWVANGVIGFLWSAAQTPPSRRFPYVKAVRINESTKRLIDQPDIWSNDAAWIYPAVSPNNRGHLGISVFYGGGSSYPSHVVGILDDYSSSGWSTVLSSSGTHGPNSNRWGDYLACRKHSPDDLTWIATGYTQRGGTDMGSIEPRYIHFGRRRDENVVKRWAST